MINNDKTKSKDNKKYIAIVVLIVAIILIIIGVKIAIEKLQKEDIPESNVEVLDDGTITNVSEKFKETKEINGMQIKGLEAEYNGENTTMNFTLTNVSEVISESEYMSINLLNNTEEVISTIVIYIGKMEAGETKKIQASSNNNICDIYDVNISFN